MQESKSMSLMQSVYNRFANGTSFGPEGIILYTYYFILNDSPLILRIPSTAYTNLIASML